MKATEIIRYGNGAVKFEFEGEQYSMNHRGVISWATPGGWSRVATDREAFPVLGAEHNSGTVYADVDQTFAGEIVSPAKAVEASKTAEVVTSVAPKIAPASAPTPRRRVVTAPFVPALVTHRETTIRVDGFERVVRTELGDKIRTVKQLEAAQLKAVKAAIVAMRQAKLDEQYADMVSSAQKPQEDTEGFPGSGERFQSSLLHQAEVWRHEYGTAKTLKNVPTNYVDARKGFPKVTFTNTVPEYMIETAPGEYATPDAAKSMDVKERVDEVVPGLAVERRRAGTGWFLCHLPSVSGESRPHLGPVFKTRQRARQVALTELARFDFTRTQAEIVEDEETRVVIKFLKLREFVAAKKANAYAEDDLRKAAEEVARLGLEVAA